MLFGDKQLGRPQVLYADTQANIEAFSFVEDDEGAIAYAIDTGELGVFNGESWDWLYATTEFSLAATQDLGSESESVASCHLVDSTLHVAGPSGFFVIDVSDPLNPSQTAYYATNGNNQGVYAQGTTLFVTGRLEESLDSGLMAYDISNLGSISLLDQISLGNPYRIQLVDSVAFIGDANGLYAVDASSPSSLSLLDSITGLAVGGGHTYITVDGDYLYAGRAEPGGSGQEKLRIYDISTPSSISLEGTYTGQSGQLFYGVVIDDGLLYVGTYGLDYGGLTVLDVSSPASPALHGEWTRSDTFVHDITKRGNYIYGVSEEYGLLVWDVSDPTDPNMIAEPVIGSGNYAPEATDILISNNYIYMPVFSGSDPGSCVLIISLSSYAVQSQATGLLETGALQVTSPLASISDVPTGGSATASDNASAINEILGALKLYGFID